MIQHRDRRTHRTLDHLAAAATLYPGAWRLVDEYRAGRGTHYPDWPDWCFVPINATAGIVASDAGVSILDLPRRFPERIPDAARLAALASWRMTQGIYRFDPSLYAALVDTPVTGDLPVDVLLRMPEWCVYVETPGHLYAGDALHGFWAHLDSDEGSDTLELRLLLDGDSPASGLAPIPIHLVGGIAQGLDAFVERARANALKAGLGDVFESVASSERGVAAIRRGVEPLVSLLLYLCSELPDLSRGGQAEMPARPEPVRTRRHGMRLFPAESPRRWDVGARIGAALRAAYQREHTGGDPSPTGRAMRPHIRRAHWHTILSGPRKAEDGSSIPSSDRLATLRWMPPLPINVDSPDDLAATIRPVRQR